MFNSRIIKVSSGTPRNPTFVAFEQIAKDAVRKAIARQKELGLPDYSYTKDGRIVARAPNGRFITKK